MQQSEILTYQMACDWVLENEVVHTNLGDVPMNDLPEWRLAIAMMKNADKEIGGFEDTPDDLIDMVLENLPLCVMLALFRLESGLEEAQTKS